MAQVTEAFSGLYRSESMTKYDVVMQRDAVHHILFHVGRVGVAQFVDLRGSDTAFNRPYTATIRRCDDLERRLRYLLSQMKDANVDVMPDDETPLAPGGHALDQLERVLDQKEGELRQLNGALDSLHVQMNRLREMYEVGVRDYGGGGYDGVEVRPAGGQHMLLGTMPTKHIEQFCRMAFRISRGNAFVRSDEIKEPFVTLTGEQTPKSVFVVYAPSDRLMTKLRKISEGLGAQLIDPKELHSAKGTPAAVTAQIESMKATLSQTDTQKLLLLRGICDAVARWYATVLSEKNIYATMNLLETTGSMAKAQVWVPDADIDQFTSALEVGTQAAGETLAPVVSRAMSQKVPPTFFRTNKITEIFQGIVDSYGVARYKEANPGVFTIVTFPYLFGIMYGDIGHGVLLTLFAGALLIFEKQLLGQKLNEIFGMIFGGRYLLFGMGLMATYVGVLYNDFFGMSVQLFQTAYEWPPLPPNGPGGLVNPTFPTARPSVKPVTPYAFGIDAAWAETENKLEFYNSVKMKCAVIVGVVQMMLGIFLSLTNHIRNRDMRKVFFEFAPAAIFLGATFGYMGVIIIVKWCTTWENTNVAPSLLETMTNFFLAPGTVSVPLYAGQAGVQTFLLLLAFSQVPLMLIVIPLLERRDAKQKEAVKEAYYARVTSSAAAAAAEDGEGLLAPQQPDEDEEPFQMSEVMIHYVIHTIEFVLGCVSNTASYLRLWALSLAHAQLSEVFLNFALLAAMGMDSGNGVVLMLGFGVWLGATIGVLLLMESLSAFLHALRLHWVEFQSKFYAGDGKAWTPFDLVEASKLPF